VLDVAAVRHGGDETHVQLHQEMRAHVHVERLREVRDLQPGRDAADAGDVDLDDPRGPAVEVLAELRDRVHRFADRDGRGGGGDEPGVALDVVRGQRLLDPAEVEAVEQAGAADRLGTGHRLVGVDHDVEVRADGLADRGQPLTVLLAARLPDLHLDALEPRILRGEGTGHQVVGAQVQPAALRVVEGDVAAEAAGEAPERQTGTAGGDVPQRRVDGREGQRGDGAGRRGAGRGEQAEPDRFDAVGLLSDQDREQVVAQHREHRATPCPDRVGVSEAVQAIARGELDEDRLLGHEALHGIRAFGLHGDVHEERASIGDRTGHRVHLLGGGQITCR